MLEDAALKSGATLRTARRCRSKERRYKGKFCRSEERRYKGKFCRYIAGFHGGVHVVAAADFKRLAPNSVNDPE